MINETNQYSVKCDYQFINLRQLFGIVAYVFYMIPS